MARGYYDDPSYGTPQHLLGDVTAALNGTVAETELMRYTFMDNVIVTDWSIRAKTGGTEASIRTILIGKSLAGTGAVVDIGTQTLGTLANGNIQDAACVATAFANGDDVVISHLGTGAGAYVIQPMVCFKSAFAG